MSKKEYFFDLRRFYFDDEQNVLVHECYKDQKCFTYHMLNKRNDTRLKFTIDNPTHEDYQRLSRFVSEKDILSINL